MIGAETQKEPMIPNHSHTKLVMGNETDFLTNNGVTLFFLVLALGLIITGALFEQGTPSVSKKRKTPILWDDSPLVQPKKIKPMSQKVTGVPLVEASLADDFVLTHLMDSKTPLSDRHILLRTSDKYQAKVIQFTMSGNSRVYLYEFKDGSLIEITEDPAVELTSYTIKKKA